MHLILNNFDLFIVRTDTFFKFLDQAADVFHTFILREGVAGPAFLIVGFERDPFLTQAIFSEPLHFRDLIDTPFQFGIELRVGVLGAFRGAQCILELHDLGIEHFGLQLDGIEFFFPVLVRSIAVDLCNRLLLDKRDLCQLAF